MATEHTLLSFITRRYVSAREDVATDALGFVLNRSKAATKGLSDILSENVPGLPEIVGVKNQVTDWDGGIPDLAGFDADGGVPPVLIEAKFLAALTLHQPNTYWKRLPEDLPATLVFLAPKERLPYLPEELLPRLREIGVETKEIKRTPDLIVSKDQASDRTLILISWDKLLGSLIKSAEQGDDGQAVFELEQIAGIAHREYEETDLSRDIVLRNLIRDSINQARGEGWVNTDGLSTGGWSEFPVRFFRLAGAYALLGVNHQAWRETGDPLWLVFGLYGSNPGVTTDQVSLRLNERGAMGRFFGRTDGYRVILDLPDPGLDVQARVQHIVDQLRDIGQTIDPEAFQDG